jgi:hypothetical protein
MRLIVKLWQNGFKNALSTCMQGSALWRVEYESQSHHKWDFFKIEKIFYFIYSNEQNLILFKNSIFLLTL